MRGGGPSPRLRWVFLEKRNSFREHSTGVLELATVGIFLTSGKSILIDSGRLVWDLGFLGLGGAGPVFSDFSSPET